MSETATIKKPMRIWGVHKKYPSLSWWQNFMSGHLSIGKVTIYGCNAMDWAVNIYTKRWGAICFTLPSLTRIKTEKHSGKKWYQWYFYISPNATPWASTFYRGSDKQEKIRALIRKHHFGHNFNSWDDSLSKKLHYLNDKMDSIFWISNEIKQSN